MVENQITALLGHNGAGKTTTMNMLIGMLKPTQGTAIINNLDIATHLEQIRENLGICPQFDILFPLLTVYEHLIFFSRMKSGRVDLEDVENMIDLIGLNRYKNNYPTELSGGWQRRVSVAIALVGNSKCVILDEPTSGMDPSTRRTLWDFIRKIKVGRTIILTTHFMDEADILGDRIAIMSQGKLVCAGSSLYLKNIFGCGYHLNLSVKNDLKSEDESKIIQHVQRHVQDAEIERSVEQEISILLPYKFQNKFKYLLTDLDDLELKNSLKIVSYGIVMTNLEEVFMRCIHPDTEIDVDNIKDKVKETFGGGQKSKPSPMNSIESSNNQNQKSNQSNFQIQDKRIEGQIENFKLENNKFLTQEGNKKAENHSQINDDPVNKLDHDNKDTFNNPSNSSNFSNSVYHDENNHQNNSSNKNQLKLCNQNKLIYLKGYQLY